VSAYSKKHQIGRSSMTARGFRDSVGSESHLQIQCEEWLALQRIEYLRIPDAIYKLASSADPSVCGEISRHFKGLPDIMIFKPIGVELGRNNAIFIELKSKSGKLSQGQKAIARRLNVAVVRSFDDFEKLVTNWMEATQ
jgi:hypothetical protein